jgi:hypothetical protein
MVWMNEAKRLTTAAQFMRLNSTDKKGRVNPAF